MITSAWIVVKQKKTNYQRQTSAGSDDKIRGVELMSRYSWHVSTDGNVHSNPRHYKHLTYLYKFILRKPHYFKRKKLSIFNNDRLIIEMTYEDVQNRVRIGLTEGPERSFIQELGSIQQRLVLN